MPRTRSAAYPRWRPPQAGRKEAGLALDGSIAASNPALDNIKAELQEARERADMIGAQLQQLEVDLRLLDKVADYAKRGEPRAFFKVMRSRLAGITLLPAFLSHSVKHN